MNAVPVTENGLGRYVATVPTDGHARLTVRLRDEDHDKTSVQHYQRSYPAEYRLSQEMPPAVAAMSRIAPHTVVTDVEPQRRRRSVIHWAYFGALGCLIASVLFRRL